MEGPGHKGGAAAVGFVGVADNHTLATAGNPQGLVAAGVAAAWHTHMAGPVHSTDPVPDTGGESSAHTTGAPEGGDHETQLPGEKVGGRKGMHHNPMAERGGKSTVVTAGKGARDVQTAPRPAGGAPHGGGDSAAAPGWAASPPRQTTTARSQTAQVTGRPGVVGGAGYCYCFPTPPPRAARRRVSGTPPGRGACSPPKWSCW
jgi:hypothetical protein